ncbi:MAG: MFS transporter [Promethearchaeota archaeon]
MSNSLTKEEIEKGLSYVTIDGYLSQIMVILTTGPFLIAFALILGASYFIIGLLAAIPPLCQIFRILAIQLVEKYRNRKIITVTCLIFYRICLFLITMIPIFFFLEFGLTFLIIFLIFQSIFAALGHTAWYSWIHDLIPTERLGTFFSRRMVLSTIISTIASLIAALFIDFWRHQNNNVLLAYSITFFIGFIFGMLSIYFISRIPEPKIIITGENIKLYDLISTPFKDKNYRNLLIFLIFWNFAINLAVPFFVVYMLVRLQLNLFLVVSFIAINQIITIMFLRIWGRLSDVFSNKSVLVICCPLFLLCILMWSFTTLTEKYILTLPFLFIIYVLMGVSMAGILIASNNISLKLAPKGKGNYYLAIAMILSSFSLATASIIAGLFIDFFEMAEFSWTFSLTIQSENFTFQPLNLRGIDFFFIFAFFIGLIALHRLAFISEEGEVKSKIILNELFLEIGKSIKNYSIVGGFRNLFINPYSVRRFRNNNRKLRKNKKK